LKRKAIEAKLQVQQSVKRRAIDLGANIPFTCLLKLVENGFGALSWMFTKGKGNPKIGKHYHVARNCLKKCLGDPLYNVLLMLVLTYRSSSVTPFVAARGKGFEVGAHKDPA
jgi:hypothetical protein